MDFLALDFETATNQHDSPCELGIAVVRGGVVRELHNWLIKPKYWPFFNPWNIAVHGIKPADVADAPGWDEIWSEVSSLIEGRIIVAHNAAFDMSVLRSTLASHRICHPKFQYFCSVGLSKKVWPGFPKYDLKSLCSHHRISLRHHRASHDAQATAELMIKALSGYPQLPVPALLQGLKVNIGEFYPGGQRTPGGKVSLVPFAEFA
ncbi:MAG: 3'-5' exonuclease [Bacteroidota bacterium]|nr:3'-5' exonuclease [Bacteroidota bacterium]